MRVYRDDKATVNEWAKVWGEPEHLIKEASKNYVLHHATFKDDVKSEQEHWDSGQYFNAGIDFAQVMTDLLPMEHHDVVAEYKAVEDNYNAVGMPILAAPKFLGGLIYGLVGTNHLEEMENCGHDGYDTGPLIY